MMSRLEYFGTLLHGGIIIFLLLSSAFFFVLVPFFKPRMNKTAKALAYSEGWVCLFIAFTYITWVFARFFVPEVGLYGLDSNTALYHGLIYTDLMALPVSMQIGYAITTGRQMTLKQFLSIAAIYALFAILDYYTPIPYVFEAAHFLTIIFCAAQLLWYWKFIDRFDKHLLDVCSNIDGRRMNWYLWIQVPQFFLAVIYIPLCYVIADAWSDVLYDFFSLIVMIFVVACIFLYRVDDVTEQLIAENFKAVTGKELDNIQIKDTQSQKSVSDGVGISSENVNVNENDITPTAEVKNEVLVEPVAEVVPQAVEVPIEKAEATEETTEATDAKVEATEAKVEATEEKVEAVENVAEAPEEKAEAVNETIEKPEEKVEAPIPAVSPTEKVIARAEELANSFAAEHPEVADDEQKQAAAVEIKSYDFSVQMKKLEDEHFYLNPDVNIDWLTRKLGTNRHYVSDYMSQILHMTFYEYVNTLRLKHAEHLITTGREKVNQVAYSSGFNSDHTFRRLFKEQYGCTPTQYLKRA